MLRRQFAGHGLLGGATSGRLALQIAQDPTRSTRELLQWSAPDFLEPGGCGRGRIGQALQVMMIAGFELRRRIFPSFVSH